MRNILINFDRFINRSFNTYIECGFDTFIRCICLFLIIFTVLFVGITGYKKSINLLFLSYFVIMSNAMILYTILKISNFITNRMLNRNPLQKKS